MKNKIRLFVIGWLLLRFCSSGWTQSGHYRERTEQEIIEGGLSHNPVYQRFKDSRGVIWLVRGDGLECFDGQRFTPTAHQELKGPAVLHILMEDGDHDLWIKRADQTIFFLQIDSGELRGIDEKFGTTFPKTVHSAIPGIKNTFLLQTDLNNIVRYRPGYAPEPFYSTPEKIITPIVEFSDGTVWIDCNNKGRGGELIALDAQCRPKRTLHYFSNYLHGRGIWGDNAFYYMTADSFFVVNETTVLLQKSLDEMCLFYDNQGSSTAENRNPWFWIYPSLATILFYSVIRYRKKQVRRTAQAEEQEVAAQEGKPENIVNDLSAPGTIPENNHSEGLLERQLHNSHPGEIPPAAIAGEADLDPGMELYDIEFLNKIQGIILEQLDNSELDGKLLSKMTGLSHSQLHRKLTALTGLPTGRYIHNVRLQEAKRLLDQKDLTIAAIAYMTGFSDPAYFTRLFTKTFGGPPRSFRN